MAFTFEQFLKSLEQSGLISPSDLRVVCEKLPPGRQHDAQELARILVRQNVLTKHQVQEICRGKAKDLVLGNYTILDQIGQGGMGQVFKAQHRKMKRLVAIKLLPAAMTKNQAAIHRFQREVEAAAKLRHPNIVAADDADESNGVHFLVMEYVEGQELSALVKKNGPLPVAKAVDYVLQVARGLEFAHGEGVVHRDVKPPNLLLDRKGVVKILDMGLARLESAAGAGQTELTGTGQIMGTVDYMAPEQALNTRLADQRADIYSLGITLWYLLTGRPAFGGETVMEKLLAHREKPIPSLRDACPGATPALEDVFTRMVAKKAEDRYQSMSEVVAELERIRAGQFAAGAVGDAQGEDHRRREFLGGTKLPRDVSGHPSVEPMVVEKLLPPPELEATITMAGPQGDTDATTEQSLVVPSAGQPIGRLAGRRTWVLAACAVGTAAFAGIALYHGTKQPTVEWLPRTAKAVQGDALLGEAPLPANAPFDANQAAAFQEAWAKDLGTEVEIENSLGMKLRLIPPGDFIMGSPQAVIDALLQTTTNENWQHWYRSESPQHAVKLTQAFYLGSCEVTQQQYQELMGVDPSHFSLGGEGKELVKNLDTNRHPVEKLTWFDAIDFCNKLSERENRSAHYRRDGEVVRVMGGTGYRLPTEAEWEYACRAGTSTRWFFGDDEQDLAQHTWFASNAGGRPHPVAGFPANPFGLYDMLGNVWEWCWDWHGEYSAGAVSDPIDDKKSSTRVYRGGSWRNGSTFCRSAYRGGTQPTSGDFSLGFRVARTIDAKGEVSPTAAKDGPATRTKDTTQDVASVKPPPPAIAPFDANQALAHQETWAKHLGVKVEIENSIGMKLRLIPPGEFVMGSPQEEVDALLQTTTEPKWQRWFRSEGPRHRVKLTQAFYLARCEVTQQQYQQVMGVNPSHFSATGPGKDVMKDLVTSQHPVESVSWFDTIDFCNKLSERERRSPYYVRYGEVVKIAGGTGYRLPREAEWEYACRAGATTRWTFGDDQQNLTQYAWISSNSGGRTQRVGELPANPFGLYDLYGNVWEWCWDWHGEYAARAVSDPTGAAAGSGRVLRGGAFDFHASYCRSAFRNDYHPMYRSLSYGFRVCCGR